MNLIQPLQLSLIGIQAEAQHEIADTIGHHLSDTLSHAAGHVAETAGHAAESGSPELPNIFKFVMAFLPENVGHFIHHYEIVIFSTIVWVVLAIFAFIAFKKRALIPGPVQNVVEWIVESLSNMITGILGDHGKKYIPFIGTLFVYIFFMNLSGIIPGFHAGTSKLNTTLALAICVFFYVQFTGIRNFGILGYLHHLAGSPKSVVEWCLVPLNLPLHVIGELAKPISLSLRLFGNISGEDMLIAIFVTLGVSILSFTHMPIGLPLHLPFIFLALLTSFVQALVFTLLTTIYFSLMSHYDEEHH